MKKFALTIAATVLSFSAVSNACDVTPAGDRCYVEETGEYISGSEFFSRVANNSNKFDTCTVGRVKGSQSGRMYYNGRRIEKEMGCLSHKEIKQIKSIYGLQGECRTYTCTAY